MKTTLVEIQLMYVMKIRLVFDIGRNNITRGNRGPNRTEGCLRHVRYIKKGLKLIEAEEYGIAGKIRREIRT